MWRSIAATDIPIALNLHVQARGLLPLARCMHFSKTGQSDQDLSRFHAGENTLLAIMRADADISWTALAMTNQPKEATGAWNAPVPAIRGLK